MNNNFNLEEEIIKRILRKLEDAIEKLHQHDIDKAVHEQKLHDIEVTLREVRSDLSEMRQLIENNKIVIAGKNVDFEILRSKVAWIVAAVGFALILFKDWIFVKLGVK